MIEKMKERDELRDKFVGRNLLIMTTDTNILSLTGNTREFENIIFKEIQIIDIDKDCNLVGLNYNGDKFIVRNDFIEDLVIKNTNELEIRLESFFDEGSIKTATIFKDNKSFDNWIYTVVGTKEKKFEDICIIKKYQDKDRYIKVNALEFIPNLKMELNKDKSIVFQFNSKRDAFEMIEMDNIGFERFDKGFYYGKNELKKAIADICNQYKPFLKEKDSFIQKIKNIIKK